MQKITMTTIKTFIKKSVNEKKLFIKKISSFDGMVDCVMPIKDEFKRVDNFSLDNKNTFGITGAWFVGSSRDSFDLYDDQNYSGYSVYNCCGEFILASLKNNQ